MTTNVIDPAIIADYQVYEWNYAASILATDFPKEFQDIQDVLRAFKLCKSYITTAGGSKSQTASEFDNFLTARGWRETQFDITIEAKQLVSGTKGTGSTTPVVTKTATPTHKVDCFKNSIALEIEWNNKDPFYDRDLNNFRLLFELRVVNVGVIITRADELQDIFNTLGRGSSYGNSTTHFSKLKPRIEGGGSGGCPVLVFAITKKKYDESC